MRTFDQLRHDLRIKDTCYELAYGLKRFCKIDHKTELVDDQWIATLEFMDENYDYGMSHIILKRLERQQ